MRARYYDPQDGRFISRDSWSGVYSRPLSLNRWNYVEGNPVNLTDPSGNHPPYWCQSMPNKAMYEVCVDIHYGIQPISHFTLGKFVDGQKGCYSGPTQYRAPGYFEGAQFGISAPAFTQVVGAFESVYDFATMEQRKFKTDGIAGGLSDMFLGFSASEYGGVVLGFKSNSSITQDYEGPTNAASGGLGFGIIEGLEIGPGVGFGISLSYSKEDPNIVTGAWYVGASLGGDPLPIADVSATHLVYIEHGPVNRYASEGKVDAGRLYLDILQGKHSGWPVPLDANISGMPPIGESTRFFGFAMAAFYVQTYEELYETRE